MESSHNLQKQTYMCVCVCVCVCFVTKTYVSFYAKI